MTRVCAWCPPKPNDPPPVGVVTHGICPTCEARIHADLDAEERKQQKQTPATTGIHP